MISKEEREHWRRRLQTLRQQGESDVRINLHTFSDVLNVLDSKDERIAELKEALNVYLDGELDEDSIRRMAYDALRDEDR